MYVTVIVLALLGGSFQFRRAPDEPRVLALLAELAVLGHRSSSDLEAAAFIVQETSGDVGCRLWPFSGRIRAAHYEGRIPDGTVALAHTHPVAWPEPSRQDIAESMRLGLPIYVVSRWDLYVIDPSTGESVRLIERTNWSRSSEKRCQHRWK